MSIGTRLRQVRGTENRSSFAKSINIADNTLRNYEQGLSLPNSEIISRICKKFGVSLNWFVNGEGPVLEQDIQSLDINDVIWIPLVNAVLSAGIGSLETSAQSEESYAFKCNFFYKKGDPKNMILMRVSGDSMTPEVADGDMVLIDQSKKDVLVGKIYAVGLDDAIYLKRIDKIPGKIILKSTNKAYENIELDTKILDSDAFRIIGRVLWCAREYN